MKPQPVNIGGIECDALIHHELQLENQIPDYPVEEGFSVQDTIIQNPKTLTLTVVVTNTPVSYTHLDVYKRQAVRKVHHRRNPREKQL